MSELKGACVIGQSGGPTSVINSSVLGALEAALDNPSITRVFGMAHGIKGLLNDDLYDIDKEDRDELALLRYTPSSALGSCRYKLADPDVDDTDYKRILEIFKKYDIRYFFYNGGNDSMDTCNKVSKYMMKSGYECRVMGIPKTIANDLETIQSEGHDAVRKVDANMVVKKKGGKDVEVPDGWAGHILPFDLVQEKLLSADLAEIGTYESRLTEISSEIADILENLDEDDKNSTDAVSEDGDSFVATELKKAVKSIGKDPETDFDRALVNAQRLFDEEREVKKNVKNLRSALDEKTRTVIEGLSGEQAADLLAAKWVEPLQRKLEELPQTAVDELIASVNALNDKYSTTYSDVCEQIEQAEAELGNMLDQLTGNEFDMAGIAELKTLLGGK